MIIVFSVFAIVALFHAAQSVFSSREKLPLLQQSISVALVALSIATTPANAGDQLTTTLKIGEGTPAPQKYLYKQFSGAGIINGSVTSGSIPGITFSTFDNSGTFYVSMSGNPTTAGTYPVRASYGYYVYENQCDYDYYPGCEYAPRLISGTLELTVIIEPATLTIGPNSLGNLTVGQSANVSLSTSGGSGNYVYSLGSGNLPSGMALSGASISGTPTTGQAYSFSLLVSDSYGNTTTRAYSGTVNAPTPTVSLSASSTSAARGETVVLLASVSGGASPTGLVVFKDGTTTIGSTMIENGTSSFSTQELSVGSHSITALYTGDMNNSSAASSAVTVEVTKAMPSLTLTSSNNNLTVGDSVTFTATLSGGFAPSGTVTFESGTQTLGTATISGGTATFVTSGLSAGSHSITALYEGDLDNDEASSAALAVNVQLPVLALSPVDPTLIAGTAGVSYGRTFSASNGTAPYSFSVIGGSLPPGLTMSSSGNLSGIPAVDGSYSFTVLATDADGATGTQTYNLAIAMALPLAANSSATVAANSSSNSISLSLSGGSATSLTLVSLPLHGMASALGTTITYTPASGYSGMDSLTYFVSNDSGVSAVATVSISVTAPTLAFAPADGSLAQGVVGSSYSVGLSVSAGTAPYEFRVSAGSLAAGLSLSSSGLLSGVPTSAGTSSFTVTATDVHGAVGTSSYVLIIAPPAVTYSFSPSSGQLPPAMVEEDYSQAITASGGTGSLFYSVASGSLPPGMTLNVSTGTLTGPLSSNSEGTYSFIIAVRDSNGSTGSAPYSLTVRARAVTVADKTVTVQAGETPPDVYLNRDATGGPFTSAELVSVEPEIAGSASIRSGELADASNNTPVGWYLQFRPNPSYSGQVHISYKLFSALGISNAGIVTYNLSYDPSAVASNVSSLVQDFISTRQSMISSTIKIPGLRERRHMETAWDPVTTRLVPAESGLMFGFSTSLAQIEAARSGRKAEPLPFNIWTDGTFAAFDNDDLNHDRWGSFTMLSLGADYLLSDRLLLGFSFHYDRTTDPTDAEGELRGNGWLAGPYASLEIGRNVFWDTSLLYGGSANNADTGLWSGNFETARVLAETSVSGQWELSPDTVLTPRMRAVYLSEQLESYTLSNSAGDALTIEGFHQEQFRMSLGTELARSFVLSDGSALTPSIAWTGGYSGLGGAGAFGSTSAGVSWQSDNAWRLDAKVLLTVEDEGTAVLGAKLNAERRF